MSHSVYFVTLFICALLVTTGSCYKYFPEAKGWITRNPVLATWDEALEECRAEGTSSRLYGITDFDEFWYRDSWDPGDGNRLYNFKKSEKGGERGAVLMSPITEGHLRAMQSMIKTNTTYYVGTRSLIHARQFVSAEGIPLSYMAISDVLEPVAPQVGLCVVMDRQRVYATSCSQRLPFMCYKQDNSKLVITECGTFDQGYKYNNITESCYKFHNTLKTWLNGYLTCASEGAYLSIVNDAVEAQEITKIITNRNYYTSVGLRDWQGGGDWMSTQRDRMTNIFNTWIGNRQPTSACCNIGTFDILSGTIREWGDNMIIPYLCEKDPNNVVFPRN